MKGYACDLCAHAGQPFLMQGERWGLHIWNLRLGPQQPVRDQLSGRRAIRQPDYKYDLCRDHTLSVSRFLVQRGETGKGSRVPTCQCGCKGIALVKLSPPGAGRSSYSATGWLCNLHMRAVTGDRAQLVA